ncbi:MAG: flagellar FliJ family protein [Proteobacteria bacterium]|nr:flagellar FliJ family protein [Pseudomonadota bacterium]
MSRDNSFIALKKKYEIIEREALQNKVKIDAVVEQRKQVLSVLEVKKTELIAKSKKASSDLRTKALLSDDFSLVNSVYSFQENLRNEIKELDKLIAEKAKELSQATERAVLAEKDWQNARIDVKKVDTLIENKQQYEINRDSLIEEINNEEVTNLRKWKKDS